MRISLLLATIWISILSSIAQEYVAYDWLSNPAQHQIADEDKKHDEIILKYFQALEVVEESYVFYEYKLKHEIIRVNSDHAVEKNNRIYIPLSAGNEEVLINKARVVTSTGKIVELDTSDIQEAVDEQSRRVYKYFAIEGIDKGSEIETLQLIKKQIGDFNGVPYWCGDNIILQSDVPMRNVDLEIITNDKFAIKSKASNMSDLELDTLKFDGKNTYSIHMSSVAGVGEEEQAVYYPNLKQIDYKIVRNTDVFSDVYTYQSIAAILYDQIKLQGPRISVKAAKNDLKKAKKILKAIKFDGATTQAQKIRAVEDYIKLNYRKIPNYPNSDRISFLYENKAGSEKSLASLYAYILDQLNIKYELVYTSDRYRIRFDNEFEAWHYPQTILFYFPELDKYLEPGADLARLGYISFIYQGNYGMFISDKKEAEVRFIEAIDHSTTGEVLNVDVQIDPKNIAHLVMDYKREVTGYYAQFHQIYYDMADEEQVKKLDEDLIKYLSGEVDIIEYEVSNKGASNFGVKPLLISSKLESNNFVEKAGPKYLFKIGDLIGPQMEMYQEKSRKFDIENQYTRTYKRHIEFNIPKGYLVKNLETLKLNYKYSDDEGETMVFVSDYKIANGRVIVDVLEYYDRVVYPKEQYEDYRKVINAAADFNKVILVLEKK